MNEATWKIKCNNRKIYPGKVLSVKENITNSELIAKKVKNFFTETGPKFATKIETPSELLNFD